MAFQDGVETLTCSHCGSRHRATWHRTPVREEQFIRCQNCGKALLQTKGTRDYLDVELIQSTIEG